jgi:hypothetical protein
MRLTITVPTVFNIAHNTKFDPNPLNGLEEETCIQAHI